MADNREEIRNQLEALGAPDERLEFYLNLCEQLLLNTLTDANLVRLLAYAPELDKEVEPRLTRSDQWNLIQEELQSRGTEAQAAGGDYQSVWNRMITSGDPMGTFAAERMRASDIVTDAGFIFSDLPAIVGGIAAAGGLAAFAGYWGISSGAAAWNILGQAPLVGRLFRGAGAKAARGAGARGLARRVGRGALVALGGATVFGGLMANQMNKRFGEEATTTTIPTGTTQPGTPQPGATTSTTVPPLLLVDSTGYYTGTPGSTIEVDPNDLAGGVTNLPTQTSATGQPLGQGGSLTGLPGDLNPDTMALLEQYGALDTYLVMQSLLGEKPATWNPLLFGEAEVTPSKYPLGISLGGQVLTTPETYQGAAGTAPWYTSTRPPWTTPTILQPEASRWFLQEDVSAVQLGSMRVPPGATIAPQSMTQWGDRTLLQYGAQYAQSSGIPVELLYGIVTRESGWNPYAVGDNGTSFGLAQIHLPEHPGTSEVMASNPQYALAWTANNLARNFQSYGSWEAAILAHRNPEGAQYLASTGNFASEADQQYVMQVASAAYSSGLGNTMFGGMNTLLSTANVGSSGSGRVVPPFVEPDRDKLRQWLKQAFDEVLLRKPTETELEGSVGEMIDLYKDAYQESVKEWGGQTSREIDPESIFLERLEESGEGQYREDTAQNRSMFEYLGQVASILRSEG